MRILLADGGNEAETLSVLTKLLPSNELAVAHADQEDESLGLAIHNALPGQEVVTVPIQVVVEAEEPSRPRAILGLHSLRTLIGSKILVICAFNRTRPVVIGKTGKMEPIAAKVAAEPAFELLARRLDAHPLDLRQASGELSYARLA
jgi:hypothetical protein